MAKRQNKEIKTRPGGTLLAFIGEFSQKQRTEITISYQRYHIYAFLRVSNATINFEKPETTLSYSDIIKTLEYDQTTSQSIYYKVWISSGSEWVGQAERFPASMTAAGCERGRERNRRYCKNLGLPQLFGKKSSFQIYNLIQRSRK